MSIRVALNHKTEYCFDRFVSLSPHLIRLWPAPHCRTPILSRSLKIAPAKHFINWQQDPHSNHIARVVFPEKTRRLCIEVDVIAEMTVINPFDFFIEPSAEKYPFSYEEKLAKELAPFLETKPGGPFFAQWMEGIPRHSARVVDFIVGLNQNLQQQIKYLIRMEPGVQTPDETLRKRSGSCRDTAWLLVQVLRHLRLAARFVSGYLIQLTADVKALDGPSGTTSDFTDLHAWAEVYLPGAGWVGLDPTSGLLAGEGHIPLACSADPSGAGPIEGNTDECKSELNFSMSVKRIHEDPRVTKPYTDTDWKSILELGHRIDAKLEAGDVRLTMGGEPTFVSIDHPDDVEWNTAALGPRKRILAGTLIRRLRDRFARGALLHYGQGKWYPGESLPRWALGCYWRKDNEPVWSDPKLCADETIKYGHTEKEARAFVSALADRLGVDPHLAIPGYEDIWQYMLKERRLPVNVDPLASRLSDPEERRRLSKVFEQGLDKIIGYALPVQRRVVDGAVKWVSGPWFLRRENMYLIPGDSPMGLRLPLDSLPWSTEGNEYAEPASAWSEFPPLPPRIEWQKREGVRADEQSAKLDDFWRKRGEPSEQRASEAEEAARAQRDPIAYDVVRTALCVEPRDGQLYVFMPPQKALEDYLNLITAVEQTAADLRMPVLVEGYTPPHDPRLNVLKVTPDPGVIEVNLHPAANWNELVNNTSILYEEARLSRLTTEKFMLDGRHTGTGGGNHVIIGGATPADSPLLRRPDVLKSLLGFWHNHPALSFLFSGLFIGPTSQHPRVDEARNDSLYELELAFKQIAGEADAPPQPWLVDRALRNLLIDCAGNTHRTEFCIDKLYSPDSSNGRLGLVELRSFEMPPHYQMSLAQQLLLRAVIAHFWGAPYQRKLVRWGTELHDRFMLPEFVRQDFNDALDELSASGCAVKPEWFAPHFEFRFPLIGAFARHGVEVELRTALEPWHVLGEEGATGGAVRYVDSSVERLQVKVRGMTDTRHLAVCNGRALPLHPTGTSGEFVAGVRYKAWRPPSGLHPLLPVNSPLTIDIYDTWNGRSIGGCAYHVSHPGGRAHETFPVNANEAEGRRAARFFVAGHTQGKFDPPAASRLAEFPYTLDLRAPPT